MLEIKVKELSEGCMPQSIEVGDWIDLKVARDTDVYPGQFGVIPLGIAMELPKGYEAHVVPRSSTFKAWGIMMSNSVGIIDNSYCGDEDEWGFPYYSFNRAHILKGTRIAQFRIVENQPKVEFIKVDSLGNDNRGGFGSTGK